MTIYILYKDDSGEILTCGNCHESAVPEPDSGLSIMVLNAAVDWTCNYVKDGQVVPCAKKPTAFHALLNGQWIVESDLALEMKRNERSALISATEWLVQRHRDQTESAISTALTDEQYAALQVYRQALRDWPSANDPSKPFPDKPSFVP